MISTSSSGSDGSSPPPTVAALLGSAARRVADSGSDTPRLDAEVLLAHVLGVDRATLLASSTVPVSPMSVQAYETLVSRRVTGEPVAYIRGLKEFYGLAFTVDRRALIPRPETELLVDLALARVGAALTAAPRPPGTAPLQILDVGTGSGAIAITLAVEARKRAWSPELHITAVDTSSEALSLALENAVGHGVADAVAFQQADLMPEERPLFNVVVANLPYVPTSDVGSLPVAASFEPIAALDGGMDGLEVIRRLVDLLPEAMHPYGVALLEFGAEQADGVVNLRDWEAEGWGTIHIHSDLGGRPRVAEIRWLA